MIDSLAGLLPALAAAGADHGGDAALTVALALAAGLVCQALAHHLRIPGLVLLLGAGAILGPDILNIVRPAELEGTLQTLVGFAVAVILFEGGMNLQMRRLRRETASIRDLITAGAVVTAAGAAVAARLILDWDWRLSILFGTLVIVTGPTVITPLVRRIKVNTNLQTVLEAEGVLIDPIGAIIAVVALEVAIQPSGESLAVGILQVAARLGLGAGIGLVGGFAIAYLLRPRWLLPEGLQNVFTLSLVLALFHISNAFQPESGIACVTVAGLVVGNIRTSVLADLMEFKEQLTVMLIALLFVLLSADVRFAEVGGLAWPGIWTALALIFVVRPLNVLVGTARSGLSLREKAFLAWMAPRGIVAAAVASFFAVALDNAGIDGGAELRAMVFLVIAVTVLVSGLTGGLVAGLLGVRRRSNQGYVILGANDLGRALGRALREGGETVTFLDSNPDAIQAAEADGFRVVFGNALEERTMLRARIDSALGAVSITPNEEVNLLFVTRVREGYKVPNLYAALHLDEGHITEGMLHDAHATLLFGAQRDIDLWSVRVQRKLAALERWRVEGVEETAFYSEPPEPVEVERTLVPLVIHRKGKSTPVDDRTRPQQGDEVTFLVFQERRDEALRWLTEGGWIPVELPVETGEAAPAT